MASLAEALAQTFLPSTCAICRQVLPWQGSRAGICPDCWDGVVPHTGLTCPVCGNPEIEEEGACLACRTSPPPWQAAASLGPYAGTLREMVLLFKSRGRDELAAPLAALLLSVVRRANWPPTEALAAVPMTWLRRLRRGYNQADLLARALGRDLGVPCVRPLTRRGRGTQVGRARSERMHLSAATFPVRRSVAGCVVLVDDVFTTGATAAACTRALQRAGAREVRVLTLARTPQPGRIP
jgi:ComF family protein